MNAGRLVNQTRDGESAEVERLSIVEGIDAKVTEDPSLSADRGVSSQPMATRSQLVCRATRRSRRTYYLLGIVSVSAAALTAFCAALGASVAATEIRWLTASWAS